MTGASARASPISDADVTRLIAGKEIETLAFYDVSDQQIYGRKHLRRLTGDFAERATLAGCEPVVIASIAEKGIIEPIIVRQRGDRFQIVAGERRYQASVQAGLRELPVIIAMSTTRKSSSSR